MRDAEGGGGGTQTTKTKTAHTNHRRRAQKRIPVTPPAFSILAVLPFLLQCLLLSPPQCFLPSPPLPEEERKAV